VKIISNFHDYYDTISKDGIDNSIIYLRYTKKHNIEPHFTYLYNIIINMLNCSDSTIIKPTICYIKAPNNFSEPYSYKPIYILFCGIIKIMFAKVKMNYRDFIADYITPLQMKDIAKEYDNYLKLKRINKRITTIDKYNLYMSIDNKKIDIMNKTNFPIIILIPEVQCIINPCLKDFNFHKIMDPYTTFQEIQMYISGVLQTEDKVTPWPVSDKIKSESKGFNKFSFRRQEHPRKSKRA